MKIAANLGLIILALPWGMGGTKLLAQGAVGSGVIMWGIALAGVGLATLAIWRGQ